MLKTIKSAALEVGMYVILPVPWLRHSFLSGSFTIKSRDEITRIIDCGLNEVTIDSAKGLSFPNVEIISHSGAEPRPEQPAASIAWNPDQLIPTDLKSALKDKLMPKKEKAKIIYQSSIEMMRRLLEDPKAENIREVKKEIADMVDVIISDDQTALHMLAITAHDFYTYTHSVNVGVLGVMLSRSLFHQSDAHNMHELGAGFFLHDLGKTRVDPAIINKPEKLTEDEMKKMRIHPYQSYKILAESGQLSEECRLIALQHHERDDGGGYPRRLRGGEIHIYGRIGCIADVYDALTALRSYKPMLSPFAALNVMKKEMINHFEKDLFEKFVLLFKQH